MIGSKDRVILTPEHVQIVLRPAGPGTRWVALVVDAALALALSSVLGRILFSALPQALAWGLWATASFVITWGYHVFFETWRQGLTPGKRLVGLRVVDGRGLPLTFEQSFVRNVVRVLDAAPAFYGVGALAALLDPHRRRLGDVAADTLVIQESRLFRGAAALGRAKEFASLRTPRVLRLLRHRVGLEEREFLLALTLRAEELDPRARFDLMEEVGGHYRAKLEIDDPRLSDDNLVRGLTALLHWDRRGAARSSAADRRG